MSAGLVAVLVITAALLCVALGLVWWVNRPLSSDRAYARQTLPLFGSDIMIDAEPIMDEEPAGDDAHAGSDDIVAATNNSPSADSIAALLRTSDNGSAETRAHRFAPPPGVAPVSSTEPPRTWEREPAQRMSRVFTTSPSVDTSATPTPQPQRRAPAPVPAVQAALRQTPNVTSSTFDGQSIRFAVPGDGTLQFLPGRLEITAGKDTGREIRFVRLPGPDGSRVTFGRVDGPMYRHVQLHDPTVSRKHAIIELAGSSWMLTNLSTTNPVVFNDRLLGENEAQSLTDGDRIEMGEVVFRYRAR